MKRASLREFYARYAQDLYVQLHSYDRYRFDIAVRLPEVNNTPRAPRTRVRRSATTLQTAIRSLIRRCVIRGLKYITVARALRYAGVYL